MIDPYTEQLLKAVKLLRGLPKPDGTMLKASPLWDEVESLVPLRCSSASTTRTNEEAV